VPVPVEKQVVLLYAGANGYIDTYPESALKKYELEMLEFVEKSFPDIFSDIKEKKQLDSMIEDKLYKALNEFRDKFVY
jgi:F-type H+-transporting ATPase subunit alpha